MAEQSLTPGGEMSPSEGQSVGEAYLHLQTPNLPPISVDVESGQRSEVILFFKKVYSLAVFPLFIYNTRRR